MRQELIPPFCLATLKADGEFVVYRADASGDPIEVLGPDNSSRRIFRMETSSNQQAIAIKAAEDTLISIDLKVRPNPLEQNTGIPVELSEPVHEPTIQELIRQYVSEAIGRDSDAELETPDDFFDFEVDDDMELFHSPYEQEMVEEYPLSASESESEEESHQPLAEPAPQDTAPPDAPEDVK